MPRYAEGTEVSPTRSRAEIERLLEQYGATGFVFGQQADKALIAFEMKGRHIRMTLAYPPLKDFEYSPGGRWRGSEELRKNAQAAEIRRLWRELVLLLKAKLVAVKSSITSFEKEFLGDTVLPNNAVVFEWLEPQLEEAYRSGRMPPLIPGMTSNQKQIPQSIHIEEER